MANAGVGNRDSRLGGVFKSVYKNGSMTKRLIFSRLLAATVLSGTVAHAQSAQIAQFDADVAKAVKAWNAPGLAIAIVRNDSVLFAKGYGLREMGKPEVIDADTRFAIGSTTKAMTVLALGMLVDEGKVRWDAPVTDYLPAFKLSDPYVTRALTVRDILTHRTGLGGADLLWAGADYTAQEIFQRTSTIPLAYPFRSGFVYQNIMYALAGDIVRAVSGMSWDAFLTTRIFGPLGMKNTVTQLKDIEGKPNVASPHGEVNDTLRLIRNRTVDPVAPAGSVWSSVNDMSRWMRFVLDSGRVNGKRLIKEETFKQWLSPQNVADPNTYPALTLAKPHFFIYALGWFLQDYNGQAVAMHTGSIDGMSALIGLIPDKKLGVYVLANGDHVELRHALMYEVFDRFGSAAATPERDWSAELLAMFNKQTAQAREAQQQALARRVTGTKPSLPMAEYAGTYRNATYGDAVITVVGDSLRVRFGSAYEGSLTHWQYETFRARWVNRQNGEGSITFRPDGNGRIASLQLLGNTFTRIAPSR